MTPEQGDQMEKECELFIQQFNHPTVKKNAQYSFYEGYVKGHAAALTWIPVTPETMPEVGKLLQVVLNGEVEELPYKLGEDFWFIAVGNNMVALTTESISHYRYLDTTPPVNK